MLPRSGNGQVYYKQILEFCVNLLICMEENYEVQAESWPAVLHVLFENLPRGVKLLPDAHGSSGTARFEVTGTSGCDRRERCCIVVEAHSCCEAGSDLRWLLMGSAVLPFA